MTLYQRVSYIGPTGATPVAPQSTSTGALGHGLFVPPTTWPYNTYAGPGCYATLDQGLIALMASDPSSPWGNYNDGGYRIVIKPNGAMDVLPFMQAMSALTAYGSADEGLTTAQLQSLCQIRPVEMRCGYITPFVLACAIQVGITARQIRLVDATQQNFFDDGHVACEAKINGAWVFFDVPNGVAWADGSGTLLALKDIIAAGVANCVQVKLATKRSGCAVYPSTTCWISAMYHMTLASDSDRAAWFQRIYQVPGIDVAGGGISWGLSSALASYATNITNYPGTGGLWTTEALTAWIVANY